METLIIYLLVFANIFIIYLFFRSQPETSRFLYILVVPVVFNFLNFPLRALLVLHSGTQSIPENDILSSLFYATVFTTIMLMSYRLTTNNAIAEYDNSKIDVSDKDVFLSHVTFGIAVATFSYKFVTNRLFALFETASDLHFSFGENIVLMFDSIKWFCLASCFIIYFKNKRPIFLFEGVIVISIISFESFAATSKGTIVALLLFYLVTKSLNKTKINYLLIFVLSCAIYLYMLSTYLVRYYGVVRGKFDLNTFIANYSELSALYQIKDNQQLGTQGVAERFNYLDGLVLVMNNSEQLDKGIYFLGGIAEFLNAIPRYFWPDRDIISFNMYLTQNIWGYSGQLSETPIGRLGESFFVLGYFGLFYAVFYGYLFSTIENKVFRESNVTFLSMYFVVLYYYVWSDAHIAFFWKTILWTVLTIFCIGKIHSVITLRKQTRRIDF